jgi:Zn finger protein HypA/HybF involved in hydrogenase expression|tara:strand:- start:76 stop:285 length:210 start_codon:yes stop_codon:yes gene_type:complete
MSKIQKTVNTVWVCSQCGGDKIQQKSWTYINTDKLADYINSSSYYCEDCHTDEIGVVEQSELTIREKEK